MDMKKKSQGFTLVETMVGVGVVAVLLTMGSYAVFSQVKESKSNEARVELEMISVAALQLAWDTGRWPNKAIRTTPGSVEIWDISDAAFGLMGDSWIDEDWKGPYYDGETLDPWGNPYFFDPDYRVDGVMRVVVGSFGPNGRGRNLYDEDDIYVILDE